MLEKRRHEATIFRAVSTTPSNSFPNQPAMMCPVVGYDSTTTRTDSNQNYELLVVEDYDSHREIDSDTSFLLQNDKELRAMKPTSGCKLVDSQGLAVDSEERAAATTKLTRALAICVVFMVLETVGGQFAGSLAVLADAAHMLSDVAGFAISLLALRASGWVATPQQTFGYFRLEVLGALVSVQIIWVMTGIILYEAFQRLYHGIHIVDGRLMFCVACVGLVLNLIMIFVLGHGHDHGDSAHGHGHSLRRGCNHDHNYDHNYDHDHHDHEHEDDLEDGHSRKPKSGGCTYSHKHGHEKHLHHKQHDKLKDGRLGFRVTNRGKEVHHLHKEHEKINDGDLLAAELSNSGTEGQRDCGCSHEYNEKPDDSQARNDGEHFFQTGEAPHTSDSVKNLRVGNLEENYEMPLSQGRAHAAIFALRGEEPTSGVGYGSSSGDADLDVASDMLSAEPSGREQQELEDEIQGHWVRGSRDGTTLNINLRGAYLHALGDLIQNIGVLITGLVIWIEPEWQFIDLLCSVVFSIVVMMTTTKMLKDIMWVLMESSSKDLDVEMLKSGLLQISGVSAVLDLHVWALTPGTNLLSCHVEIRPGVEAREVLHDATEYCTNIHQIKHVTIQIEEAI